MAGERILILEDDPLLGTVLAERFRHEGWDPVLCTRVAEARAALDAAEPDVVLSDLRLPDGNGVDFLRESAPRVGSAFVMMTAHATVPSAVEALKLGAKDYLEKPFTLDRAVATVRQALELTALRREVAAARDSSSLAGSNVIGESAKMQEVFALLRRLASADTATVLIEGESGTGKGAIAQALHRMGRRAAGPFVNVQCAALPETLMESELFGHEKGSFTGADRSKQGLFEAAHRGTLFLDEAGEMSLNLQAKLLRVLTEGQLTRVGATTPRKVDVRIIVATHRDLLGRVRSGDFREDLYYRLAVVPIAVPPLRDRREDIPSLVRYLLRVTARELKVGERGISAEAIEKLRQYDFPGNVRELRNLIERANILATGNEISAHDLFLQEPSPAVTPFEQIDLPRAVEAYERSLIARALDAAGGVQAEAARRLGVSRSDLAYKIKKHRF